MYLRIGLIVGLVCVCFVTITVFNYAIFNVTRSETRELDTISIGRDIWNTHRTSSDPVFRRDWERLLHANPPADNLQLVDFVKRLIDPPSRHPIRKPAHAIFQTPQARAVDERNHKKRELFFVEAGALDGERSSNTIWLEAERNWTGLLVEVDPFFYTQLRGKARTAFSINACLSGKVQQLTFHDCPGGCGRLSKDENQQARMTVPCLPLQTMMAALQVDTIDYFSLDVEGHEREVLGAIPWDSINIKAITVEYPDLRGEARKNGIETLKRYMKDRGYEAKAQFDEAIPERDLWNRDILFVKK